MLDSGEILKSRKLLLATGVIDHIPEVEGLKTFYGSSVFHCPYCDGWELRGEPLAVYGQGESGSGLALELTLWTDRLVLCTDGPSQLTDKQLKRLAHHKVRVRQEKMVTLKGRRECWNG